MALFPLVETRFRCPGQDYWIDRSTHLARLADGFVACRTCLHRLDANSPNDRPGSVELAPDARLAMPAEGPSGVALSEIDVTQVRRFAAALGAVLCNETSASEASPQVAVAGDGRWITAEFVAAACEGLCRSGCHVTEMGASTAGRLERWIEREFLAGGLLVGNTSGAPHSVSLKCWGPAAMPCSAPGMLEPIYERAMTAERFGRRSGGRNRIDFSTQYRAELVELFHALRPLHWILDTASLSFADDLRQLTAASACRISAPRLPPPGTVAQKAEKKTVAASSVLAAAGQRVAPDVAFRRRRLERLRAQVIAERADFGLWADGDGDTFALVDERGRDVSSDRLLWSLAVRLLGRESAAAVVLENETPSATYGRFERAGARVVRGDPTREAMGRAMRDSGAAWGGGPSGRLWFGAAAFGCQTPGSDTLRIVGLLLQLLSQGDLPLSEVLA